MSKYKNYKVYNKFTRKVSFSGTYKECMTYFNQQDLTFRKQNKIIPYESD